MTVGRPTDDEIDRVEELVEEHFGDNPYGIKVKLWNDGDVHMVAYSTIATNCTGGVPKGVLEHRETIKYERGDVCIYREYYRKEFPEQNEVLERTEIDF